MRNLQKILALALALIMSFSLVVTANAAFSDEADINETYNESVNVLAQLEVFRGYTDGSYKPQDSITRAEVAAIIYRIATGDVSDSQVSLYSDWNRFKDVASGSWYAGYVNYCANAEYIKGYEDGSFRPNNNVTGYEALAMILRAVGYGKMDEFVGSNWAVNTAARANTLKISKNVTAALLGSPASREVVAELLFRSILVPTVTYNNAFGYQETDTTLGYDSFKLEAIEGVVVANEWANLYDTSVLADGKTQLELTKDDVRTLDIASALTDVGESRYAYVSGSTVYALEDTGLNEKTFETGAETDISTDGKFSKATGLSRTDDTEFYVNFGREGKFTCDRRLEFEVTFKNATAEESFDKYQDISKYVAAVGGWTVTDKNGSISPSNNDYAVPAANYPVTYNRIVRANEEITPEEMNIIEGIFAAADNVISNGQAKDQLTGDVFLGTKSNNTDDDERDISNTISFRKFKDEYINSQTWDRSWEKSENGQWVKVVDNNDDGKAEYAFLTQYHVDEVVGTYTRKGETFMEYNDVNVIDDYTARYAEGYEPKVGDIVIYTKIDGVATIKLADKVESKVVRTISYKDTSVTTTDGETYFQSGVHNDTDMDELIVNMDEQVSYHLYLDEYGYVRAYEPAEGIKYGLLTEMYYGHYQNGRYVTGEDVTVELTSADTKTKEFIVANGEEVFDLNAKIGGTTYRNWNDLARAVNTDRPGAYSNYNNGGTDATAENNTLQPASHALGLVNDENLDDLFAPAESNVAEYITTADGEVKLASAAKYAYNKQGEQLFYTGVNNEKICESEWIAAGAGRNHSGWLTYVAGLEPVYAVNYLELEANDVTKGQAHWYTEINKSQDTRERVDALNDTEIFVVTDKSVTYVKGYTNIPKLTSVESVYTVAENTNADKTGADYWVARVIVIQVPAYTTDYSSVSLIFNDQQKTDKESARTAMAKAAAEIALAATGVNRYLPSLNDKFKGENAPEMTVIPTRESWRNRWESYGFYELRNESVTDEGTEADISFIGYNDDIVGFNEYNDHNIYAGVIDRNQTINRRGDYLDVIMDDTHVTDTLGNSLSYAEEVSRIKLTSDTRFYTIGSTNGRYFTANELFLSSQEQEVQAGDKLIWAVDSNGKAIYIVDLSFDRERNTREFPASYSSATWLDDIYADIISEQRYLRDGGSDNEDTCTITVKGDAVISGEGVTGGADGVYTLDGNSALLTVTPKVGFAFEGTPAEAVSAEGGQVLNQTSPAAATENGGTWLLYGVSDDVTLTVKTVAKTREITVTTSADVSLTIKADGMEDKTVAANKTNEKVTGIPNLAVVTIVPSAGDKIIDENQTAPTWIAAISGSTWTLINGINADTYTASYTVIDKQDEAILTKVVVKGVDVTFSADVTDGVATIKSNKIADTTLTVAALTWASGSENAAAVIKLNGTEIAASSKVALADGDTLTIETTSEDETAEETYTILIVEEALSDACTVTTKAAGNGVVVDPDAKTITVNTTTATTVTSGAAKTALEALLNIPEGATTELATSTVVSGTRYTVTAEDGEHSTVYTITLTA